jgi:hypothetical protein
VSVTPVQGRRNKKTPRRGQKNRVKTIEEAGKVVAPTRLCNTSLNATSNMTSSRKPQAPAETVESLEENIKMLKAALGAKEQARVYCNGR